MYLDKLLFQSCYFWLPEQTTIAKQRFYKDSLGIC